MNDLNIGKSGDKRQYMFNSETKLNLGDDVNIVQRPTNIEPRQDSRPTNRNPNLNESSFDHPRSQHRPNLTHHRSSHSNEPRRGYVPMEGLDLLSNPKKFDREEYSTGKDSNLDNDQHSINSNDNYNRDDNRDDNRHSFENRDGGSDSDTESISSTRSSRSSTNRSEIDSEMPRKKTFEEIQLEKQKYLFVLDRLSKSGYEPTRKYTMASNYDDIVYEVTRLKRERDIDKSIKFQRKLLMAFTSGVEFLNNRFDPLSIKLDNWSEHCMENITDYDEVFEELHDKYADKIEVAPELKLVMMVAGSGFMYHLTQTLFKSATPGLQDILRNNPDIMRNISQAALNSMGQSDPEMAGAFNFMGQGLNMGGGGNRGGNRGGGSGNRGDDSGMEGPVGVDDILNELESEGEQKMNQRRGQRQQTGGRSINIDI
jgi:hypothetical protein